MLNKVWNWLNGKKVIIGLTLLWLSDRLWLKELLPDGPIESGSVDVLVYVGGALAGVGIIHRYIKKIESKPYVNESSNT